MYCCAGLDGRQILMQCERFDVGSKEWSRVPNMNQHVFSHSCVQVDKKWIYSFGGATYQFHHETGFQVERLDTSGLLPNYKSAQDLEKGAQWEVMRVDCKY